MRSIMSSGMLSQVGLPVVAEPRRTPSTSKMVWRFSLPRTNTLEVLPSPPLELNCRPAERASSSGSVRAVDASMVFRVMTVRSLTSSSARVAVRVAVTTTSFNAATATAAVCDQAGSVAKHASGNRPRRAGNTGFFMGCKQIEYPHRLPRRRYGRQGHAFKKSAAHVVGRYPGWRNASIAFPGACSTRPVAV